MINGLGEAIVMTMAGMGLKIENEIETQDSLTLYVSVPEYSYERNVHNEEMSGMRLAKRYKEMLTDMGVKRLIVKARIRTGEHWTKEMREEAELEMRKMFYGSQY